MQLVYFRNRSSFIEKFKLEIQVWVALDMLFTCWRTCSYFRLMIVIKTVSVHSIMLFSRHKCILWKKASLDSAEVYWKQRKRKTEKQGIYFGLIDIWWALQRSSDVPPTLLPALHFVSISYMSISFSYYLFTYKHIYTLVLMKKIYWENVWFHQNEMLSLDKYFLSTTV